jgi:hypothetical protein
LAKISSTKSLFKRPKKRSSKYHLINPLRNKRLNNNHPFRNPNKPRKTLNNKSRIWSPLFQKWKSRSINNTLWKEKMAASWSSTTTNSIDSSPTLATPAARATLRVEIRQTNLNLRSTPLFPHLLKRPKRSPLCSDLMKSPDSKISNRKIIREAFNKIHSSSWSQTWTIMKLAWGSSKTTRPLLVKISPLSQQWGTFPDRPLEICTLVKFQISDTQITELPQLLLWCFKMTRKFQETPMSITSFKPWIKNHWWRQ